MANNGKGIGPQKLGGSKSIATNGSPAKMGAKKGDQSKSRLDYESPAKMGAKKGDQSKTRADYMSPAKKNKGMSFDIKEGANPNLSAKARRHYDENAEAANKSGYKG